MSGIQLAIRFSTHQIDTIDALAAEQGITRSAAVKQLVDEAERARIASRYANAYRRSVHDVDAYGDLTAMHEQLEADRSASSPETW